MRIITPFMLERILLLNIYCACSIVLLNLKIKKEAFENNFWFLFVIKKEIHCEGVLDISVNKKKTRD